ncbi:MAG: hypothetical protein IKZ49_00440 [Alphaproteobacteria bacterium]|nr:hypothetical protein [Alphaproteobacteria bacterium]
MKRLLFIIFCLILPFSANSAVIEDCLKSISEDNSIWQERLFDKTNGIFNTIKDDEDVTDNMVEANKNKIYTLLAADVLLKCNKQLSFVAKTPRAQIDFTHNNKEYAFDFDVGKMLEFIDMRTGIIVTNKRNYSPGDVMQLSDFPQNTKLFSDECSDHTIWENLDDDAAVNKIGQSVFNEFGGSKNEFFLDFAEGDNRRAFPGLVLMDKTYSTKETIVSYHNIRTGMEKMEQFASALKSSECANQGLTVYLVALDVKKDTSSEKRGWMIGAGVGGGAMAYLGTSSALLATTSLGATSSVVFWSGVAANMVHPVGWIVAGVAVATATAIALYPSKIENLQQVMVIDGPFNL